VAKPVVDRLLLEDDVEDVASRADVAVQRAGDGVACAAPQLAVRLAQHGQRLFQRELAAVQINADSGA